MAEKKNSILGGLFWRFGERILAQVVTFIVSLVIARILAPEAYGMVAILMVFITLADALVTSGIGNALIQKKDCDDTDFSSVFYSNVGFALLIYAVIFVIAPFVEEWYGSDYTGLATALWVLAIRIPISAVNNVQHAYVSRHMIFKKFFFATLGGTIGAAAIGIVLAVCGFGYWALIAQYLFNATVDTIMLWFTVKWRPKKLFSASRLVGLIRFGWKLMVSSLLEVVYNDLRTLLIGKTYTSEDLAYYNRGKQFPGLVIDNVNTAILGVMFPALCAIQDNDEKMRQLSKKAICVASYVISPLLIGLAVTAESMISVLLTDKWLPAVWFVRMFCIIYLFQPIMKPLQQVINARGRSDISLIVQVVSKAVGIAGVIISIPYGVKAIAVAHLLTSTLNAALNMIVGGRMIKYSLWEQIKDMAPSFIFSAITGICIYFEGVLLCAVNPIVLLLIQISSGIIIYVALSLLTHNETFRYLLSVAKRLLNGKLKLHKNAERE